MDKSPTREYNPIVGARVDPVIKTAVEAAADRKGQTVSRFLERVITAHPSVKVELDRIRRERTPAAV